MSALIGRVRSSTAFAKLMQIMRAGTEDDEANDDDDDDDRGGWGMGDGGWEWEWACWCAGHINAGLMSQVAQKGFCGCVCLDTSRANPWPDKLYELCWQPQMNHWTSTQTEAAAHC